MDDVSARLRSQAMLLPAGQREVAVLQLLGRLGTVTGEAIGTLIFTDQSATSRRRMLHDLAARKLIWQGRMPVVTPAGRSHGRPLNVYGLTEDGKQLLDTFGVEPHDGTFERLIARSKQAPTLPSLAQLTHDTYVSTWCASLLDQVRRTPPLEGVQIQRRYALTTADGTVLQTIGTLITLVFDGQRKTLAVPGWGVPWLEDVQVPPSLQVIRLALEVDAGVMAQRAIAEQALTYRRLTDDRTYWRLLGGPVFPVLIAPAGRRARLIAEWWMAAWPGTPAIIASDASTADSPYGVLWGEYKALAALPLQARPLLGTFLGPVERWPARSRLWPGTPPPPHTDAPARAPQGGGPSA